MAQRTATDDGGAVTAAAYYEWDYDDQLMEVHTLAGVHNYFEYDGNSQRVVKEDSAGMTKYHWDGLNVILERDDGDTTTDTHTHGPVPIEGIGTHLTTRQHEGTPKDLWYQHDAIGGARRTATAEANGGGQRRCTPDRE